MTTTMTFDTVALAESASAGRTGDERPEARPAPVAGPHANAFAVTSFVLGLASVVSSWTFVAPVIGLVLGALALRRGTEERTLALWGVWLNIAMLALTAIAVLLFAALLGFGLIALPVLAA